MAHANWLYGGGQTKEATVCFREREKKRVSMLVHSETETLAHCQLAQLIYMHR